MENEITRQKLSSVSKKLLSLLLSLVMLFSVTSAIPITAEAASYKKIAALKVPRIYQQAYSTFGGGDCNFDSVASVQAYVLTLQNKSYSYGGTTRSYSYGKDYKATNSANNAFADPICKKMYSLSGGTVDPTGILSKLPVVSMSMETCKGNTTATYEKIYNQLKKGKPVVVHANGSTHASVVIGYIKDSSGLSAANFSVMEITQGGQCWKNSTDNFNKYANNPQAGKYPSSCYRTLQSWLNDNGKRTINQIYYPTSIPSSGSTQTATCTIAYNANGGTGSMGTSTVKYNNKFTLAANTFKRSGYSFDGWNVCRKSDGKWFTTNGNGWKTASNISSKGYTKKVYNDRWSGTLDNSWFSTVKNDTYTFYAIWKKSSSTSTSTGSQVVEYAKKFKGYPYVLNTHGPNSFDCSGFVYYVFKNFGVTLSTASSDYYNNPTKYGTKITGDSNAQLGDIVVWSGHVGIYIGSGKVINALNPSKGVCETKISEYINSSGTMNPSHFYIRVKGIGSSSSGSITTPTITNPSVTVNAISDLTTNSVRINFTAKNPSKVTIKTIGVQVRKKGTSDWKTKQEAMNASYTNAASVPMWWIVGSGKELNMSLTSGTTYEYRAYVVYNGKNYYSSISTFTTKGTAPHTHNYNYVTVTIRPTCTEGGYTEYRCSCGDSYIGNYTSAAGHKAVTDKAVAATCTKTGKTAGSHCSVCNTVITAQKTVPAAGHSYDTGKITKQPTATATGIKTFTCIDCGATKTETLPVTRLKTPTAKTTVNANGGFTISWNKISGADKYDVYIDNGTGYKLLRTVTGTSTTTGTAHYGKKYSYKVRAVNSKNSAVTSAFSTAVTAVNTKKLVTPKLQATVNANGTFKLSWNKVEGATFYQLYIRQSDGSYKLMKTTTATSFTTAFAAYGKQYTYKVQAVTSENSSATSAYSSAVNAKNTKKLQTPSLKVAVNKNGSFKLSWGKVTGATSYQIYMKQANGTYKLIKTTSSTSFTTAVAAKGKTYSYKVRAVTNKNSSAASNYSNVVSAKRK